MTSATVATAEGLVDVPTQDDPARRWTGGVRAATRTDEGWLVADDDNHVHTIGPTGTVQGSTGVDGPDITALAPLADGMLAGTASAHLYRVATDGAVRVSSFDHAPGRDGWHTPWGGPPAVRSIAVRGDDWFVNVHVGGIVRSRDGGATWEPTLEIGLDIHEVVADPASGLLLAAAGAGGLLVSEDDGDTWHRRTDGLHATYCRAVAAGGDTVYVTAARGHTGRDAAVYRGSLAVDGPLEPCRTGLPDDLGGNVDTGWLDAAGARAVFVTQDGAVYASEDAGATWSEVVSGLDRPVRVSVGT